MTPRANQVRDVASLIALVNDTIRVDLAGVDDLEAAMDMMRITDLEGLKSRLSDRHDRYVGIAETLDGAGLWISLGTWRATLLPYPFTLDDLYADLDRKYHQDYVSDEIDRLEDDIEAFEGFKVVIANWRDLLDGPDPERYSYRPKRTLKTPVKKMPDGTYVSHTWVRYPAEGTYRRPAGGRISIATWLRRRIAPLYPGYTIHAVLPDGRRAPESMTLAHLRETWSSPKKSIREPLTRQADREISSDAQLFSAFRVTDMAEFMRVYSVLLGDEAHLAERDGDVLILEAASCLWTIEYPTSKRWELEALERFKWLITLERSASRLAWSIEHCDRFRPRVQVNDFEADLPDDYGYSEPASDDLTIEQWQQLRIGDRYPTFGVFIRRPDGSTPRTSMKLRTLRRLWKNYVY